VPFQAKALLYEYKFALITGHNLGYPAELNHLF